MERRPNPLSKKKRRTSLVVRHVKRRHLEWMHKPFGALVPTDIQPYVLDRERKDPKDKTRVSPATVDREIDLLSQVITWARDTLRIHIYKSPLEGLMRPTYWWWQSITSGHRRAGKDLSGLVPFPRARDIDAGMAHGPHRSGGDASAVGY